MANIHGNQSAKTISGQYPHNLAILIQSLIIFIAGAGAVIMHARFRNPIGLPGHHGLEFMALAATSVLFFKFKLRGVIFSLGVGSALFLPFIGYTDPFFELVFMLPAVVLCLFADFIKIGDKIVPLLFMIFGGIAYMTIPLARLVIHAFTAYPYKSLLANPFYVVIMHFVFGFAGTLLGYYIHKGFKKA